MIRDPSDGSVREAPSEELIEAVKREAKKPAGPDISHEPPRKFMAGEYVDGLPAGSKKDKHIARLKRSREWLKDYHAKQQAQP